MIPTKKPDMLFIKMCEKADDLQRLKKEDKEIHNLKNCEDAYYVLPNNGIYYRGMTISEHILKQCEKSWWIPSQKQMQGIITKGIEQYVDAMEKMTLDKKQEFVFVTLMNAINSWAKNHKEFYTSDQLWLSYLMIYKFNVVGSPPPAIAHQRESLLRLVAAFRGRFTLRTE